MLPQQLPKEQIEWRRYYGWVSTMIYLESNFVQFKGELLLLLYPFFIFIGWNAVILVYKVTVKDDLTKWNNVLKGHSPVD